MTAIIVIAAVALLVLYLISLYNQLIRRRNEVQNAYHQIAVQLQRRYDLIPNLVEVAKKYMQHERETLEAVIAARNLASDALKSGQIKEISAANQQLASRLAALFATVENYPDLKANQQMALLSEELASTENRIAFSRQYYNEAATDYNNGSQQFPANLIAGYFKFTAADLLEIPREQQQPVSVQF